MRYVLANWKMYPTTDRAVELLAAVQAGLEARLRATTAVLTVIACPPYVALPSLQRVIDPRLVRLGAQNCHWEPEGPYTGEISAVMLKGLVDYVLIGHSERRTAGETDEQIARKVSAAADAGLTPILFVGEDEPTDTALDHAEQRLIQGLAEVDLAGNEVLVVYEPTWAIGAEQPAGAEHVSQVVEQLKVRLGELGASEPQIIYGGTVNADNVEQFTRVGALDGVGATRASLDADEFLRIVDRVAPAGAEPEEPGAG